MKHLLNKQIFINSFPRVRMRRNRLSEFSRKLTSENNLSVNDLIYPIFITHGSKVKEEISSMPGIYRHSLDLLHKEIEYISSLNIPAIALFPRIENELKTPDGKEALNKNNLICKAIKISKQVAKQLGLTVRPHNEYAKSSTIKGVKRDKFEEIKTLIEQGKIKNLWGVEQERIYA